ncbi:MAG: hypothetical protein NTX64_02450 [Elusimicrobia bacterium]|nr:hypothetical protein [Elusimicrobiota bacterium]
MTERLIRARAFLFSLALAACLLAPAGCAARRKRKAAASSRVPAAFAVTKTTAAASGVVPPPFTVHPSYAGAPYPAPFFVNINQVLALYLDALQKDPALAKAYDGYYRQQTRTFEQFWRAFKQQTDRIGDIASIYPATALPMGAYKTVRGAIGQGERNLKRELSKDEEVANAVNYDIRLAMRKVAQEGRVQVLYDSSGGNPAYVDPLWDLTDSVTKTLFKAKAGELAELPAAAKAP